MADVVVVNKCDGERVTAAKLAKSQLEAALSVARSDADRPPLLLTSALEGEGLPEFWRAVTTLVDARRETGAFEQRRREQLHGWFEEELQQALAAAVASDPSLAKAKAKLSAQVIKGERPATIAASDLVAQLLKGRA
jgi:LAO/AO transport system kinase